MQIENQKLLKEVILTHEIWKNENHEFNSYFGGIRNFGEHRYGDTRVLISEGEWKKIHAEKSQIVKETINSLLEAKKVKFDCKIVGLSKNRKIEHIREEREKLQIERNRTIKYSNFDLYDVPRTDWGKVYLRFHPSLEYKAVIDFDKYLENLENRKENIILNELIICCKDLQGNNTYYYKSKGIEDKENNELENSRNRFIRDLLNKVQGINVKDQTQYGSSASGVSPGEIDLLIKSPTHTIIEALNLNSVDSTTLNKHIKKLEDNYDPIGFKEKYLVVYADIRNGEFNRFCEKYKAHIDKHSFEFEKTAAIKEIPIEDITDTKEVITNIRVYQTSHLRENVDVTLFHILVKMPVI